ncbi:hypothetical protein [Photobacterium piscicola]|uniref:Fimbrial-type adhesion domain-containing protein n=1 Tax=Photobacterium piscicola TaxID=1378299 RepID=A0ABU6LFQ8_9GAMM|nr:hypothetical protein [Photobacterium piscicola]
MEVRSVFLFISVSISLSISKIVFAVNVTLSPGDTYIAHAPLSLSSESTSSPNGGVCFGFAKSQAPDYFCQLPMSYSKSGIKASVYSASAEIKYEDILPKMEITNGIITCTSGSCSDSNKIALFKKYLTGTSISDDDDYYSRANLNTIKITASNKAKPGTYIIPVSISNIDGAYWKTKRSLDIFVTVRNTTCTMMNKVIDVGRIFPGNKATKKIDLNLDCNNSINGASWKYTNINYNGTYNTNLKNVFIKVKNNKNNTLESNKDYSSIDDLSEIFIEIDARKNAQGGKLNVPLRFTLTYS